AGATESLRSRRKITVRSCTGTASCAPASAKISATQRHVRAHKLPLRRHSEREGVVPEPARAAIQSSGTSASRTSNIGIRKVITEGDPHLTTVACPAHLRWAIGRSSLPSIGDRPAAYEPSYVSTVLLRHLSNVSAAHVAHR